MRSGSAVRFLVGLVPLVIVTVVLAVGLVSGQSASAAPKPYWIRFDTVPSDSLCVGQQVEITGSYGANLGDLAPLTLPDRIVVHSGLGTVSPQQTIPGGWSGSFSFYYTAPDKASSDEVAAWIEMGGDSVASTSVRIKTTDKCAYRYSLKAVLDADTSSGDVQIAQRLTLKARGRLKAEDPREPLKLSDNGTLELVHEVTKFAAPECGNMTPIPGRGWGTVRLTAEPDLDGYAMTVRLWEPVVNDEINSEVVCADDTITLSRSISLTPTGEGPWIEKVFPSEGGTFPVTIDIFRESVDNISGSGTASYTATLTLERIDR